MLRTLRVLRTTSRTITTRSTINNSKQQQIQVNKVRFFSGNAAGENKHTHHHEKHIDEHHDDHGHHNDHSVDHHDEHHDDHHGHGDPVAHNYFLQKEYYPLHDERAVVYGWEHVLPRQKPKANFFTPDPQFDSHQWWDEEENGSSGSNARTNFGQEKPGRPNAYPSWWNWALLSTVPVIFLAYWIGPDPRTKKYWYQYPITNQNDFDRYVRVMSRAKAEGRLPSREEWKSAKGEKLDEYDPNHKEPVDKYNVVIRKQT